MLTDVSSCMHVRNSGFLLPPYLMMDSCRLRKLDPGLDATYSMPVALMTSTMKSEPGRLMILSLLGGFSLPSELVSAACAGEFPAICVPMPAAADAAAPFRNARRSNASLAMQT